MAIPRILWIVRLLLSSIIAIASSAATSRGQECKCIPSQPCWPSEATWSSTLNTTVAGQLIRNEPVALPCYPGPAYNAASCAKIQTHYGKASFQEEGPVGFWSGLNGSSSSCPPSPPSAGQGKCTLGDAPVYTVNATEWQHVAAGIAFAREHRLRLVIRDTGHDLLGRSTGFGSLQIWIRHLRTGIEFHSALSSDVQEQQRRGGRGSAGGGDGDGGDWTGPAFTIGGGYTWTDVNAAAAERNVVVVGGGTPTVGCIGGYMQGGGHSFATHNYGLAADNVLRAKVVLANGSLVTASPTENPDLFFAIRGGGGGTYGVVVETTVKAWPDTNVVSQTLAFAPRTSNDTGVFMDVLTDLYQSFPELSKGGWSGYGSWAVDGPAAVFANFTTGYAHYAGNFNKSLAEAQSSFAPMSAKLQEYNETRLIVSLQYTNHPTYWQFYQPSEPPAGTLGYTSSRFLDEKALLSNRTSLLQTLSTLAGSSGEYTSNTNEFFGAAYGRVAADGRTSPVSGVNPAWRSMVVNHIVSRGFSRDTPAAEVVQIGHDVEHVKGTALRSLAPDTGVYMNEANFLDPDYEEDFYGSHYNRLRRIKRELDPDDVFYCQTCVGSHSWVQVEKGQLCRS
ncbi:isoamyl alcohol oxidase [Lecanosticta acicola]|uniref:Isoamyl alcohol oxidase n=1 Tax=Lecanosticta acicola TaxID=111012 RepID=A0AAI8Z314_9PEZI|nr:isoamyl alcohol oxidase [Lecanosticta acicola]